MPAPNDTAASQETGLAVTRHLPVPLNEKRKLELLDELANHIDVYKQLEKLKEGALKTYTRNMKEHRIESEKISETIKQGVEMKPIPCQKFMDYARGHITVKRIDTGDIIEERAMDEEDLSRGDE